MLGLTASVAMQVALVATAAGGYQEAYNQADKEGKPFLVLVGAELVPRLSDDEG